MSIGPRILACLALLAFVLPGAAAPRTARAQQNPGASSADPARNELIVALTKETNRVRRQHGCFPLERQPKLEAAADGQAGFMAVMLTAQHTSPIRGRETPGDRVRQRGFDAAHVAENVISTAVGDAVEDGEPPPPASAIAAALVEAWMDSPGHRANLLGRDFSCLGVSVRLVYLARTHHWCAFGVQVFAEPTKNFGAL